MAVVTLERPSSTGCVWPIAVLTLCHAQAIASFQILNILIDPIKASLAISDTQYSLLQGLAVAIFAAMLGIPAARWADSRSRRNVILVGACGWSLATLGCAFVTDFAQFFAARIFMGIGEVFLFPAALSLIADLVPRGRLSSAVAAFGSGGPVGAAAALFGGQLDPAPSGNPRGLAARIVRTRRMANGVSILRSVGTRHSRIVADGGGAGASP